MIYHCANCNKEYDYETQGVICPHQLRTEGGKDRLEPWPQRSLTPKDESARHFTPVGKGLAYAWCKLCGLHRQKHVAPNESCPAETADSATAPHS